MKQNTRKLFSLLLALVMALSLAVPAFAAEGDPPAKELHWVHLQWDEEGRAYVPDDALKSDDPGEGSATEYDLSREDGVLFFIWNNKTNKREGYVVPEAGDGLVVEKLDKEAVASGAKQSSYYVILRMTKFQDSEVTAKGLSFHVTAKLGDFGFYSAESPSADSILANEVTAADLTGGSLYFCAPYMGTAEAAERDAVTKVEKDPNVPDHNKCYDIEEVKDGVWKLTLNDVGKIMVEQGGVQVSLNLEVKQPDGNTRQDGRGIFIKGEEQGPQLWFVHLNDEWDDMGNKSFFTGEDIWAECEAAQVHAGDYAKYGIFGTIKDGQDPFTDKGFNWNAFTPVDVKDLKVPSGLTVESVADQAKEGEKLAKYFVRVSVAENGREYKLTSGDYAITIDSSLPDIGVYSAPTASFDTWLGEWDFIFHLAYADKPYYIISTATDAEDGRHLTDAKFSTANFQEGCGNAMMDLEKAGEGVYKLSFKKGAGLKPQGFHVELDLTWTDFMGNSWTDENRYFGDFYSRPAILAGDSSLVSSGADALPLTGVLDKVSTSVDMNVGQQKTVYLYAGSMSQEGFLLRALNAIDATYYRTSDPALTLAVDENDPTKFTLSASQTGTYDIWYGGANWDYPNMKLYHADGKQYTDAEWREFDTTMLCSYTADGSVFVKPIDADGKEEYVAFEEMFPGEKYEVKSLGEKDFGFYHLTVNVSGEAKTFEDVTPGNWSYNAVNWAAAQGIANGTSETTFSPDDTCTHAHILTFLWRAVGKPESSASYTAKNDWAAGALAWAYEKGMIGVQFDEDAPCTSADAVSYIWQAKGKPVAAYDGRFTDVAADAPYAAAVAWAVEAGVTNGMSETTFAPDFICDRGRIVTFLYRAFAE